LPNRSLWLELDACRASKNVPELFLALYYQIATGDAIELVRATFLTSAAPAALTIRRGQDPITRAFRDELSTCSATSWLDDFTVCLRRLTEAMTSSGAQADDQLRVALIVTALRALDPIIGKILRTSPDLTFPTVPATNQQTLVYRPLSYFASYRELINKPRPWPLEHLTFDEALDLRFVYVIPPERPQDFISWKVGRLPKNVDDVLASQPANRFTLISVPHDEKGVNVAVDAANRRFTVTFDPDPELITDLVRTVSGEIKHGASIIALPELVSNPDIQARLGVELRRQPGRVGLLFPGSEHVLDSGGTPRNRAIALDPTGSVIDGLFHDKITVYSLPTDWLMSHGAPAFAASGVEVLEGIDVAPRRLILCESRTLGRILVVICRDILETPVQSFCRKHRPDHTLVLAMSPSLEMFRAQCAILGRDIDGGVYVVNVGGCPKEEPAFFFVPVRMKKSTRRNPGPSHRVCVSTLELGKTLDIRYAHSGTAI
jgi:hypothetical protein